MGFGRQADMLITQVIILIVATTVVLGLWLLLKRVIARQWIRLVILIAFSISGIVLSCAVTLAAFNHYR